jgi:hypothetical protein
MVEYKEGITVITPTGDRQLALDRCYYYIARQTIQPNQWIIADDSKVPHDHHFFELPLIKHIPRDYPEHKAISFTSNILSMIDHIEYDKIIVFEDDDWYHESYIDIMLRRLEGCVIAGEPKAVYYNIRKRKYRVNGNTDRASFCQTAFKAQLLCKLKKYCKIRKNSAFVDQRLWTHCRENKLPFKLFQDGRYCIGIKGMPGRKGIGIGHRPGGSYQSDPKWNKLREFIGHKDTEWYIELVRVLNKK